MYGLLILLAFLLALTIGFVFELGKKALTIDSRQTYDNQNKRSSISKPKGYNDKDDVYNLVSKANLRWNILFWLYQLLYLVFVLEAGYYMGEIGI